MKNPSNPKERNLVKGAIRRVFSRSDLRRQALAKSVVNYSDGSRPRVKKWSICPECEQYTPTYKMEVDHINPVVPIGQDLIDLTWDQLIDNVWCELSNLRAVCKECHKTKSKLEGKERRRIKKERKNVKA